MSTELIRLSFHGSLHIGRGAEDLDKTAKHYSSDALKSAIFATGLPWYQEWGNNTPESFFSAFRISSAFPYCDDHFFIPRPPGMRFDFRVPDELGNAKKAKKITYIDFRIFSGWVKSPGLPVEVDPGQLSPDGEFLFAHQSNARNFLFTTVQQRVVVSQDGKETRPFYFEKLYFGEGAGLAFLLEIKDESLRASLLHSLSLLGESGIGTDRSIGNGQFIPSAPVPVSMPASEGNHYYALGLYLPTKEELMNIDTMQSNWSLVKRGGYLAAAGNEAHRSLRKNSIHFFSEGSVFLSKAPIAGKLTDLRPEYNDETLHPVWRCGQPLFIHY